MPRLDALNAAASSDPLDGRLTFATPADEAMSRELRAYLRERYELSAVIEGAAFYSRRDRAAPAPPPARLLPIDAPRALDLGRGYLIPVPPVARPRTARRRIALRVRPRPRRLHSRKPMPRSGYHRAFRRPGAPWSCPCRPRLSAATCAFPCRPSRCAPWGSRCSAQEQPQLHAAAHRGGVPRARRGRCPLRKAPSPRFRCSYWYIYLPALPAAGRRGLHLLLLRPGLRRQRGG